jgi:cyclic-di-GMP-binding protein
LIFRNKIATAVQKQLEADLNMVTQTSSRNEIQRQFDDGASCQRWLESLPLTNFPVTQQLLVQQISLARHANLPPIELLRILNILREPVAYVQSELARKYTAQPLPLDNSQSVHWLRVLAVWEEMFDAYSQCRDAYLQGDEKLRNHRALIAMHCLRYVTCMMFEHYRVYRQVPATLWKQLYQLYSFAEQHGIAHSTVAETLNHQKVESSCATVFCQALLAHLAHPYSLSGRQIGFLAQWAEKWSAQISIAPQPFPPSAVPAHAVDLAAADAPDIATPPAPSATVRYLDFALLSGILRQTITSLKQGQTPVQLGLGEDARQPGCENLLMLLYVQWCRGGTDHGANLAPTTQSAKVCLGMPAVHFHVTGRAFRAPGSQLTGQEERDMQMFGHISERTQHMLAAIPEIIAESWRIADQGSSGFLCMLREAGTQTRISHNQLVAVRNATNGGYQAGLAQWLRETDKNEMFVGVRLFVGTVRGVAVRPTNFSVPSATRGFERGLLLPEITAASVPATLILPTGWYSGGRIVEIHDDGRKLFAKLESLLERGSDFERCTITLTQTA